MARSRIAVTCGERAVEGSARAVRGAGPSQMRDMREVVIRYPGESAPPADEKPPVRWSALRGEPHMALWEW